MFDVASSKLAEVRDIANSVHLYGQLSQEEEPLLPTSSSTHEIEKYVVVRFKHQLAQQEPL